MISRRRKMYTEEYGKENEKIIIMLHGGNFVHSFSKQYVLGEKNHIIVPHLMGYGNETANTFDTEKQIAELADFIEALGKKVLLVGFSLGAQIAYKLVSEHQELFCGAIIISPWLDKNEKMLAAVLAQNEKQFKMFKKKGTCNFIGLMNGLSKPQRKEFVEQMQKVTIETMRNAVDNGITLESVKGFESVKIPVYALAGAKEQAEVTGSVRAMSEKNPNCKYEIWEKAAHNIPPLFAERLNKLIEKMAE